MNDSTFNLTVELMKRHIDDLVYSSVQIEGIGATFAQTREIVAEGQANGVPSDDIHKIVCIKRSLEFLFSNYGLPADWSLYSTYNAIIGEGTVRDAGQMRGPGTVRVDDYYPADVSEDLFYEIMDTAATTAYDDAELVAQVVLNLSKAQFFHDGNKRTALVFANHLLAQADAEMAVIVTERDRDEYLDLLLDYYHGRLSLDDASWDFEEKFIVCAENPSLSETRAALALRSDDVSASDESWPELALDEPRRESGVATPHSR